MFCNTSALSPTARMTMWRIRQVDHVCGNGQLISGFVNSHEDGMDRLSSRSIWVRFDVGANRLYSTCGSCSVRPGLPNLKLRNPSVDYQVRTSPLDKLSLSGLSHF